MRAEYKRSDFTKLERGKFYAEAVKSAKVALLDPELAKVFPTSQSVNDALHGLLAIATKAARGSRSKRAIRKRVAS